jgi:dolichol kinase
MNKMSDQVTFRNEIYRKAIHLSSLWMVLFIYLVEQKTALIFFCGLLGAFLLFEVARMQFQPIATFIRRYFSLMLRENEKVEGFSFSGLTGSFYFLLSVVLSLFFFDKHIAMLAISIMILSDTMAALIGKKFGRRRFWGKSLEGATAFLVTTFILLCFFAPSLSLYAYGLIAVVLTGVEFCSHKIHINDNLSLTLVGGGLIEGFSYFSL